MTNLCYLNYYLRDLGQKRKKKEEKEKKGIKLMSNFIKLPSKVTIFDYQTYCISACKATRTGVVFFSN